MLRKKSNLKLNFLNWPQQIVTSVFSPNLCEYYIQLDCTSEIIERTVYVTATDNLGFADLHWYSYFHHYIQSPYIKKELTSTLQF